MYPCNHPEDLHECTFGKRRNLGIIAVKVLVSMRVICLDETLAQDQDTVLG